MLQTLVLYALLPAAEASSHRESPAMSKDPTADLTDFYAFISPEDSDKIVFIANVIPAEEPSGGPNFYHFDDDVLYEIHVDNQGDGLADVTFQFQTQTTYQFGDTFLYNDGYYKNVGDGSHTQISDPSDYNIRQTYTITRVEGSVSTEIASGDVAPANVGERSVVAGGYNPESSTPGSITSSYIESSSGYRTFAGPRQEGFYLDLGHTFDLLGLAVTTNENSLLGKNVHSIAIEVDADMLTRDGAVPSAAAQNDVIATWATASRKAVMVRRPNGDMAHRGPWVQVSRLGSPLVNEVVIPLEDKDLFNASNPVDDATNFLGYVLDPLLPVYMNVVLGTNSPASLESAAAGVLTGALAGLGGREDLAATFLTGFSGFCTAAGGYDYGATVPGETVAFSAFEALRLNLNGCPGWGGADTSFYPDGRWVKDDVIDISLWAMDGVVVGLSSALYPVADGVDTTGLHYLDTFPFLGDPWSGATY